MPEKCVPCPCQCGCDQDMHGIEQTWGLCMLCHGGYHWKPDDDDVIGELVTAFLNDPNTGRDA